MLGRSRIGNLKRNVVFVAVAGAKLPRGKTRDREPHGAIHLERRYAEQARLLGIDAQVQVGAQQPRRIVHIARARRRFEDLLDLTRRCARRPSISGPTIRIATGASTGGPCSNCFREMRAAAYSLNRARSASNSLGVRLGSNARNSTNTSPTVGGASLRKIIVVNERRAMAQVRVPALDLRMLGEARLDEPQRAIGFRDARTVRGIHPDDELRHIRARKQTETNDAEWSAATTTNKPSAASSVVFGLRKRPAQRRAVDVVNDLHHPLQQLIGKRVEASDQSRHLSRGRRRPRRVVAQHAARQKRE